MEVTHVEKSTIVLAYDPSLGKTSEDFRFIFFLREAQEKK